MIKTLLFILILLFISPNVCFAQKQTQQWRYEGPRVGIDLSRFLLPYFQSGSRHGWEIQGDMPYKGNWFPTVEMGMEWFDDKKEKFHYLSNGVYGRAGVDLNIAKFESLKDHDLLYLGIRYGFSHFTHESNEITYSNYWGIINTSSPRTPMNAHWAELAFGMKGEIFNNFFLGWSLRAKFPFFQTNDPSIKPYIIPGLGKTTGEVPMAFTFSLSYRFPIFRTKSLPAPIKIGGSKHPEMDEDRDSNPQQRGQYQSPGRLGSGNY